jgi:3',5'-cyclic AMP phosphodiesterase CpdA
MMAAVSGFRRRVLSMGRASSNAAAGIVFVLLAAGGSAPVGAKDLAPPVRADAFSFVVAGHTYGAHHGRNVGLHPRFLTALGKQRDFDFLVLTGDFVRQRTEESYAAVRGELREIGKPHYLVMGNHDDGPRGRRLFEESYGGTHYSFSVGANLFVVLDSQAERYSFGKEQMGFLEDELARKPWRNAFLFFHELLWLDSARYDGLLANLGRDADYSQASFWPEFFPFLRSHPGVEFYVIAGDVGGNPWAIPAFFDRIDNVNLVASGMGEVEDENFLWVDVAGSDVTMTVVPLWDQKLRQPVEWFNAYNLRHRRSAGCVYPACVLPNPPDGEPPGAGKRPDTDEPGLWDRILKVLGRESPGS